MKNVCRILFARGDGESIKPLAEALRESAQNDPYMARRSGKRSHADGWGYVLLGKGWVHHYRSERAIFEDSRGFEGLLGNLEGDVVFLAHARAASQGKKNVFNAQPFAFSSRRGFSFWFLHNGDLNKEEVIRRAGFEAKDFEDASDSYAFSAYLCRFLKWPEERELIRHYSIGIELTRTTFNTATLFLTPEGSWRVFITAYMSPSYSENPLNRDYAKLIELRGDVLAVASSTLALYYRASWRDVPNGTGYLVDGEEVKALPLG